MPHPSSPFSLLFILISYSLLGLCRCSSPPRSCLWNETCMHATSTNWCTHNALDSLQASLERSALNDPYAANLQLSSAYIARRNISALLKGIRSYTITKCWDTLLLSWNNFSLLLNIWSIRSKKYFGSDVIPLPANWFDQILYIRTDYALPDVCNDFITILREAVSMLDFSSCDRL